MKLPAGSEVSFSEDSQNKRVKAFVPLVLVVVVLASLFALNGSSDQVGEKPKPIPVADAAGASPDGFGGCVPNQAWVDQLIAERQNAVNNLGPFLGGLWRIGDWFNYQNYGICPPRPANPTIKFGDNCETLAITVALLIDRSSSVIKDGLPTTPQQYKNQINVLIDEFYNRFTPAPRNGQVNFLLYAFGTKAVLQNDTTDNAIPVLASNVITDASTPQGRTNLINAVNAIHFRNEDTSAYFNKNDADAIGFQRRDNSVYQRQRSYNFGSESSPGEYGRTNWQDAFTQVMNASGTPFYNNPGPSGVGKRIDLAVMITDGIPTADNGSDWDWTPGTFRGSPSNVSFNPAVDGYNILNPSHVQIWNDRANPSDTLYHDRTDDLYRITTDAVGQQTSKSAVDALRTGINPGDTVQSRPPISVKGIVISTSSDSSVRTDSENYARNVFGDGHYFFATNFTTTLEDQVKSLVTNVINESNCPFLNDPVSPSLEVIVDESSVNLLEGNSETIWISVKNNTTNAALDDVKLFLCDTPTPATTENCTQLTLIGTLAKQDQSNPYAYTINLDLGETIDNLHFVATGEPALGAGQTWNGIMNPATASVDVIESRSPLPA